MKDELILYAYAWAACSVLTICDVTIASAFHLQSYRRSPLIWDYRTRDSVDRDVERIRDKVFDLFY